MNTDGLVPSREMTLEEWVDRLPPDHRARKELADLRALVYHTAPGEYSPDGWTWKQQANADYARRVECEARMNSLREAAKKVLSGTGDKLDALVALERAVFGA